MPDHPESFCPSNHVNDGEGACVDCGKPLGPPDYDDVIVTRSAPRWAWDLIDETLSMDSTSKAFDSDLRDRIGDALAAMVSASEGD